VWTDHKNLSYFRSAQKLNRRQARWHLELEEYDFLLIHKPGRTHGQPDALSRRPDHPRGEDDNADQVLLRPQLFRAITTEVDVEGDVLVEEMRKSKAVEGWIRQNARMGKEGWSEDKGLYTWRNRIYVPKDHVLRDRVIRAHHDAPTAGHPGRFKTAELVLRKKTFPAKPLGLLAPNLIPDRNWEIVSCDMVTGYRR